MKKQLKKLALSRETLQGLDYAAWRLAGGHELFTQETCDLNGEVCMNTDVVPTLGGLGC